MFSDLVKVCKENYRLLRERKFILLIYSGIVHSLQILFLSPLCKLPHQRVGGLAARFPKGLIEAFSAHLFCDSSKRGGGGKWEDMLNDHVLGKLSGVGIFGRQTGGPPWAYQSLESNKIFIGLGHINWAVTFSNCNQFQNVELIWGGFGGTRRRRSLFMAEAQ